MTHAECCDNGGVGWGIYGGEDCLICLSAQMIEKKEIEDALSIPGGMSLIFDFFPTCVLLLKKIK